MLFNKCDSFIIKNKQTTPPIIIGMLGNSTTPANVEYKSLKFMQETCHLDYFIGLISVTSIICICLIIVVYLWKYNYFWNFTRTNSSSTKEGRNDVENGFRRTLK